MTPGDEERLGLLSRSVRRNGGAALAVSDELPGRVVTGLVTHLDFPTHTYGFFMLKDVGGALPRVLRSR